MTDGTGSCLSASPGPLAPAPPACGPVLPAIFLPCWLRRLCRLREAEEGQSAFLHGLFLK